MNISYELKEKIERNFKGYKKDFKNKLLSCDAKAIKQVGIMSHKMIAPEDIVEAYESGNIDYLYNQAKKMIELKKIYNELCEAHVHASIAKHKDNDSFEER